MKTDETGQIVAAPKAAAVERVPAQTLGELVASRSASLAAVLPRHLTPERMARLALTAIRRTPKLGECSPASFMGALFSAAVLGLEPNTPLGHCYLIPYGNECQLIVGYQGMIDLARRSGQLRGIQAYAVFQGDEFRYELGLSPDLRHVPNLDLATHGTPDALTHVYAVAKIGEQETAFEVLSRRQIIERRDRGGYARARGKSPWDSDFVAMAQKTAIRALFRWLPKSTEMVRAEEIESSADRGEATVLPELAEHFTSDGEVINA